MGDTWHYTHDGEQRGPVSPAELKRLAATGGLEPDDKVWREGMEKWVLARTIKGLFPDAYEQVEAVAGHVEKAAKTVRKVASATGEVADAVTDVAEAGDKVQKAFTAVAGLSAGGSTVLGGVGDFLRPLGPVNLLVFAVAVLSAVVLFVVARQKGAKVKVRVKLGTVASLVVALVFGLWSGLGAVAGKDNKGVLATNFQAIERAQAAVLPVQQPPVVERPAQKEPPGEIAVYRGQRPVDVHAVAWSSKAKTIATCGWFQPNVRLWNLDDGQVVQDLPLADRIGKIRHMNGVALSPDGSRLLASTSGWHDGKWIGCGVSLWDTATGQLIRNYDDYAAWVWGVAFLPDGQRFIVGSHDGTVRMYDTGGPRLVLRLAGHTASVFHVAVSPDGKRAASIAMDRTIRVWDLSAGRESLRIPVPFTDKANAPPIAFDGSRVLSTLVGDETAIKVWDAGNGRLIRSLVGHTDEVWALAVSPDGRRALSGGNDRTLRLWDLGTGKELHHFAVGVVGSTPMVKSIAFSAYGRHALVGSNDRSIRLYRLPD